MFGKYFTKARGHVNHFFGSVLPTAARDGHRFLNDVVLPSAKTAHRYLKIAAEETGKNKDISEKNQKRLEDVSRFADIGLSRVNSIGSTVNNIANRVGANP